MPGRVHRAGDSRAGRLSAQLAGRHHPRAAAQNVSPAAGSGPSEEARCWDIRLFLPCISLFPSGGNQTGISRVRGCALGPVADGRSGALAVAGSAPRLWRRDPPPCTGRPPRGQPMGVAQETSRQRASFAHTYPDLPPRPQAQLCALETAAGEGAMPGTQGPAARTGPGLGAAGFPSLGCEARPCPGP